MSLNENTASRYSSIAAARPLGLLVAFLREAGQAASEEESKRRFRAQIQSDGYEDFLAALVDEWTSIKFSTAFAAAFPPTVADVKTRHAKRKEIVAAAAKEVKQFADKFLERALDFRMPNGKSLRDCTGAECLTFGGWLSRVGKRVGPRKRVGDVLSNEQLAKMFNTK